MHFSLTLVLLAVSACLAHTEERVKGSMSGSRLASLRSRRMVGGTLAPHVPWQAMVYLSDSIIDGGYAGGALISDRWVLTAGRNLFVKKSREDTRGKDPVIPKVYLGITEKAEAIASNEVAVEKVVLHPGFQNHSDWENDLALIKLKDPVVMSDKVAPIPLPENGQGFQSLNYGVIAGWGWGALLTFAPSLKHLVLPLAGDRYCQIIRRMNGPVLSEDDTMFCTQPAMFTDNVCFGDAGGALAIPDPATGDIYAAGILSNDKACRDNRGAVFMKVSVYLPWIHSVIRGDTAESAALRTQAMSRMLSWQPQ